MHLFVNYSAKRETTWNSPMSRSYSKWCLITGMLIVIKLVQLFRGLFCSYSVPPPNSYNLFTNAVPLFRWMMDTHSHSSLRCSLNSQSVAKWFTYLHFRCRCALMNYWHHYSLVYIFNVSLIIRPDVTLSSIEWVWITTPIQNIERAWTKHEEEALSPIT